VIQSVTPAIANLKTYEDDDNGYCYIEIEPINNEELLKTWCMNPVGKVPTAPDHAYFPYYTAADNDLGSLPQYSSVTGFCPGYWNMWGDMGVYLQDVLVTGVQTFTGSNVTTWTKQSANIPGSIFPFLNAGFDFDSQPGNGATTACMVETISSQSVYASVFCDLVNLFNSTDKDDVLFSGRPSRFGAMLYGAWRVVNWIPPMGSSGRFCATIPLSAISDADKSALVNFFQAEKKYDSRPLMGIFVTFTIFEVFENRYVQTYYTNNGKTPNPARATTVGSITPWYDGDMQTGMAGRNLISITTTPIPPEPAVTIQPIYTNKNSTGQPLSVYFTPTVCSLTVLQNDLAIFSIDMGNSWPEMINPEYNPAGKPPALRGDAGFETAIIGELTFSYSTNASSPFASININPTDNPRAKVFQSGCIFDFILKDAEVIKNIQNNFIVGFLTTGGSTNPVLKESQFMICSDQKGLYAEAGDLPSEGYRVNNELKEPCRIRIFQKGAPVTAPIPVYLAEYRVPEAENDPVKPPTVTTQMLADNDIVALSDVNLTIQNSAVYYFVYEGQYAGNKMPAFASPNYNIMDTGAFVVLKVHPTKDYSKYLNPSSPGYTPPTFEVIYQEIFRMYNIVYPIMGEVYSFQDKVWNNPTVADAVLQYTDPKMWPGIQYMPRSRELSDAQRKLLVAWANVIINQNR
jgi:hypothetical protein